MIADISAWLRDGKLTHAETIVDGLDRAPGAFIDLLRGRQHRQDARTPLTRRSVGLCFALITIHTFAASCV